MGKLIKILFFAVAGAICYHFIVLPAPVQFDRIVRRPDTVPAASASGVTYDQMHKIIASIDSRLLSRDVHDIVVHKDDPTQIDLNFNSDVDQQETTSNAETVASMIVKTLVAHGYDPQTRVTNIWVYAQEDGLTTITGKPGVIFYGTARYNPLQDRIIWVPADDD